MKRILLNGAIALTLAGIITSCQESTFDTVPSPSTDGISLTSVDDPDPYIGTENQLTTSDAGKVARLFFKGNSDSRASSDVTVKNVVTIQDSEGNPAIYAVNLDDGYLLVSATKSYYPILAQVDHGTFSLDDTPSGRDVVIQDIVADIEASKDSANKFGCGSMWARYERPVQLEDRAVSRSFLDDDAYWEMRNKWDAIWYQQGASVYYLNKSKDVVPEDIWNEFWQLAETDDAWLGTGYEATNTAIVTVREFNPDVVSKCGPLTTTMWGQKSPYNDSDPEGRALGCVTVAVGQLMKYFKYPTSYEWANMPNSIYNTNSTLCPFLYTLRQELNVDDKGTATVLDALNVLKSYGYDCSLISHNTTKIENSIKKSYPVFASGTDTKRDVGHAWVIDGYRYEISYTLYTLYFIAGWKYPDLDYEEIDATKDYLNSGYSYHHHNWGWKGSDDGWFISSNIGFYNSSGTYINYSTDRSEIIINGY